MTHVPCKYTALVWSVDANVPLFAIGIKFLILVTACLIPFLALFPLMYYLQEDFSLLTSSNHY